MAGISSVGGARQAATVQTNGTSIAAQIARLRKQESDLMQKLTDLQSSEGNAEDIAKQSELIQQQIAAIELQIARLESERAEAQKGSTNAPSVQVKTVASLTQAVDVSRTGDAVDIEV